MAFFWPILPLSWFATTFVPNSSMWPQNHPRYPYEPCPRMAELVLKLTHNLLTLVLFVI